MRRWLSLLAFGAAFVGFAGVCCMRGALVLASHFAHPRGETA